MLLAEEVSSETVEEWKNQGVVSGNDGSPSPPYLLVPSDDTQEQTELLLSGLAEKHNSYLRVKNPIYRSVFNPEWVVRQLDLLRPYSQVCERQEVQMALEATLAKEVEARLEQEKKTPKRQRAFIVALSSAVAIALGLGVVIFLQYRDAEISKQEAIYSERHARSEEIEALATSSDNLFIAGRKFDALVEAIKATQRLRNLGKADPATEDRVEAVLRHVTLAG